MLCFFSFCVLYAKRSDGKASRLEACWDYCVKERFNYCILKLDDVTPRLFKIGKDGCQEIDYKNADMSGQENVYDEENEPGFKSENEEKSSTE